MGKVYYAPEKIEVNYNDHIVFLAGSIEMNKAENWQKVLSDKLSDLDNLVILNPRRPDWDSSWEQKIENPHFYEQVDWELEGIENAETVIFYFDPNTMSPITLLELGKISEMVINEYLNLIICCPEGFWRKGNVDIVIDRIKKQLLSDLNGFDYGEERNAKFLDSMICEVNNLDELIEKSVKFLKEKIK
jgi:hypothetical protein